MKATMDLAYRLQHIIFGEHSEWFWLMAQAIIILVSAILIYRQVRVQRYANLLQMLTKMRETWDSPSMLQHRQAACGNYQSGSKKINAAEGQVLGFFEEMALLLRKGVLEEEFVWVTYSYFIEHYWSMLEANIKEYRLTTKDESWFEEMERLRKVIGKVSKRKNLPSADKTHLEITTFIDGELSP
jgi:hypothetical protein